MQEEKFCLNCNTPIKIESFPSLCKKCDTFIFNEIRDYLNDNPRAKTSDIYNNTHVPLKALSQYLDDERLEYIGKKLKNNNDLCFSCGGTTELGKKYCKICLTKMKSIEEYKKMDPSFENESRIYERNGVKKYIKKEK